MTDKLSLYNGALEICGERALSDLTEQRAPRRYLDNAWDNGAIDRCLEKGQWFFAMRAVEVDPDPAISPAFGFQYGYSKPSDWILTSAMCSDEYLQVPITRYIDEAGYWYADDNPIYVKYVSNDANYGSNMGLWPQSFAEFVEAYLAKRVVRQVTGDNKEKMALAFATYNDALKTAKSRAAMALPTRFPPGGSWTTARQSGIRRDSNKGPLIG